RLGPSDDLDDTVPGIQINAEIAIANEDFASDGFVTISGQSPVPFDPSTVSDGTLTVPLTIQDGARTLRARASNACGIDVFSDVAAIVASSSAEDLVVRAFAAGAIADRVQILDGSATQSASVDFDIVVGEGPADRTIVVTQFPSVDTTSGRSCGGAGTVVSMSTVPGTDVGLISSGIALNAGVNCFTVTSDGGFGINEVVYVVSRVEVAPAIAFTDPDPASPVTLDTDADGGATPDFNYDVALALAEPAPVSGVATLEIGDGVTVFNRVTARVAADDSVVLFDNASLPSGDLTLGARFVDDIGNTSVAAPATVTVDNGETVEFALSAPQNGALLANDVGFTLEYTGAVDQTGLSCQLVSIDSAGMESNVGAAQTWGDTATPLSFSQTLTEGPSTLRVDCGGSPSQVVEIVVEDDAPAAPVLANEPSDVPGFLVFDQAPGSAFVNLLSSDDSAVAGLQHNIRILVTTPEADATGWTVELTVTLPDASTVTYTRPVGVGPSATIDIPAVEFGAMDGTIVFSAVVTDSLGRTSPTTTAELVIDRTAPVLSQVTPDPSESLF
ncbi:MAG: hypothetical protein AAFQ82_20420, partial [Myxococcota bacterium]